MSMTIDELSSAYGLYGVNGLTQNNIQTKTSSDTNTTDGDSYISTIAETDAAIPSDNYNDLGRLIKSSAKSRQSEDSTEYESSESSTTEGASGNVQSSGGSGSESSDEDDTETEIVTINGQTYLQTTTTDENGNTSLTRVAIGSAMLQ